jgi:hypothetical protein
MRYKEIIESYESQGDELLIQYKDAIDDYIKEQKFIYRGMKNSYPVIFADGSKLDRKAANTSNYVNKLTEVLPSWQNWPKRTKSFICSGEHSSADGYGWVYHVIPLENQKIGSCGTNDFWLTIPNHLEFHIEVNDFNNFIEKVIDVARHIRGREYAPKTDDYVQNIFDSLDLVLNVYNTEDKELRNKLLNSLGHFRYNLLGSIAENFKGMKPIEWLSKCLDPSVKCELYNSKNEIKSTEYELWLSGKVLFISNERFQELLNAF